MRETNDKSDLPWPNLRDARYVTAIVLLAHLVSLVERMILNLMAEPIKRDLSLTDSQVSLLLGFGFALFYAALGIPIARLANAGGVPP